MKRKRRIKKYRSLADLRVWRILLVLYKSLAVREKALRTLADAHKPFIKELNPLKHQVKL